ncbi:MAG: NRDE family protein [Saprospiraceae bacterium]|nr:NRDE family protein [Saprospiraceae bacterium]
MCTVTYLPRPEGFIITSNRDEAPDRSPRHLTSEQGKLERVYFPKDVKAGGTWIAAGESGKVLCLLNGAFEKHPHRPPYRLSRGQMALHYFRYATTSDFINKYDFRGIEPFTLVLWDKINLVEIRWDVQECLHVKSLDSHQPSIWSSSTLYPIPVREQRKRLFGEWLSKHQDYDPRAIRAFHAFGKVGDPANDLVMNRDNVVRTVSITQVLANPDQITMHYDELIQNSMDELSLKTRVLSKD